MDGVRSTDSAHFNKLSNCPIAWYCMKLKWTKVEIFRAKCRVDIERCSEECWVGVSPDEQCCLRCFDRSDLTYTPLYTCRHDLRRLWRTSPFPALVICCISPAHLSPHDNMTHHTQKSIISRQHVCLVLAINLPKQGHSSSRTVWSQPRQRNRS